MTRQSLIEWAASWVPETAPNQRKRFTEALADALKDWREPERKPRYCKNCPFAEHLHDGNGCPDGCPGFEAADVDDGERVGT